MSSISRALEKARRRHGGNAQEEPSRTIPNMAPVGIVRGPKQPNDDIRSVLKVGRFDAAEEHLVTLIAPESKESEHYQSLRFAVERMANREQATVIGVSGSSENDGKTLTTLNLAGSLARDNASRVLVVDADLRLPSVAKYLGLSYGGPGLGGALGPNPSLSLESVTRMHPKHNIAVLPAGPPSTLPFEVLKSLEVESLFRAARRAFDFVCVDMPALVFPECRLLNELLDGLLLVISAHRTQRRDLKRALEGIDSSKVIGIVFNRDTDPASGVQSYYRKRS